jgi:hypothetical protein
MRRIGLAVVLTLTLAPLAAGAQQAEIPRIGILVGGSASSDSGRIEAFRQGLRELGYVEGKTDRPRVSICRRKPRAPQWAGTRRSCV